MYVNVRNRAGNEPSYSGSARARLEKSSARELNEPSLSLNLGLLNLGLGSGSDRKSSARVAGTHSSLERGFLLRSPAGRIWSSPMRLGLVTSQATQARLEKSSARAQLVS